MVSFNLLQVWNTLPIALFSPGLLVPIQANLTSLFPQAVAPAVGVLECPGVGRYRRGSPRWPLVAVALLGVGLMFAPPGLRWVRMIPPLKFIYPMYCAVLISLP